MRALSWVCLVVAALFAGPTAMAAGPTPVADLVKADLIAEPLAVRAGEPFWVGIRLRMKERWHTYWRNPGDSGLPTDVKWTLPEGFEAGAIVWPVPDRIPIGDLVNFGYEREAVLLVSIRPPASLDRSEPVAVRAGVSWLVCENECVPGGATLSVDLPTAAPGAVVEPNPIVTAVFAAARARLPQPSSWPTRIDAAADGLTLSVTGSQLTPESVRSVVFFPDSDTLIEHAAPQKVEFGSGGLSLALKRSSPAATLPGKAEGVLVLEERDGAGWTRRGFEVAAPVSGAALSRAEQPVARAAPARAAAAPGATLADGLSAAIFAFLGGLLLNVMPCVFPVLSVKLLSFVRPGESAARLRQHGAAYTIGVLVSFTSLAAILLAVRAGGAEIGWGFQLQSPVVVAGLALVLFAMGLSLSGVYYLGGSLAGFGDRLARRTGLSGSFFTGVLASIVATPCTAPFMGAAVGFALVQPGPVALAIFSAMGLGLAAPVLVLTLVPAWRKGLPRPGPWMETLKQALAFPVYATAAWLAWVLSQQVGPSGLLAGLMAFVLVGFAAWCLSLSQRSDGARAHLPQGFALASLALVALALAGVSRDPFSPGDLARNESTPGVERFTQARLDALLAEGRPVFVNLTAAWCITCLVNERTALARDTVKAAFATKNVAYLKGDWTNQNPEITRVLERHGRNGVPLYLLYPSSGEPRVLPQILTESTVLASLENLGPGASRKRAEIAPLRGR